MALVVEELNEEKLHGTVEWSPIVCVRHVLDE